MGHSYHMSHMDEGINLEGMFSDLWMAFQLNLLFCRHAEVDMRANFRQKGLCKAGIWEKSSTSFRVCITTRLDDEVKWG